MGTLGGKGLIKCSDYCVSIGYCSTNGCSIIESCSCNVLSLGFVRPCKENDIKIYLLIKGANKMKS